MTAQLAGKGRVRSRSSTPPRQDTWSTATPCSPPWAEPSQGRGRSRGSSGAITRWRGGESHRDGESAGGPAGEVEGPVVRLGDALDDRQAEAHTGMVAADAFGAALERFRECRDQLWTEHLAAVLDREHDGLGALRCADLHRAVVGEIVDDRVVQEVRGQLQQERMRAEGRRDVPRRLDGDTVLLGEGHECLGGFFGYERQVDGFSDEGALIRAAKHEQCFGEVDRSGVDDAEAFDEL